VTVLDDPDLRAATYPSDVLGDVERTPEQWRQAAKRATIRLDLDGVEQVVVAGVGGSGVAGDVAAALARDRLRLPVLLCKGYRVPGWVGPGALLVAVSYSGGTEETRAAVHEALTRGARVMVITSGGPLQEIAEAHGLPLVQAPKGAPAPRHSLGWLAVPLLGALGLADGLDEALDVLETCAEELGRDVPSADNPAKRLGMRLAKTELAAVYGTEGLAEVAALRLRAQLGENAKMAAVSAVVPELCHNDIVGWEGDPAPERGVIWIRDPADEHLHNALRVERLEGILAGRAAWSATLLPAGSSPLARLASLVLQADFVSVYAAIARGVDPAPIRLIDQLKEELAAGS
jgi:glucose/mannose-6-phosphate isomerase